MATANGLTDGVRDFLGALRWASIATLNADGSAHQAIVWYLLDGDRLLVNSRRGRQWPRNLERDGQVSLAVQDWSKPEHWVGIKGRARILRTGADALRDIEAMARRYGRNPDDFRGQDRVTFEIDVQRTFEYGS